MYGRAFERYRQRNEPGGDRCRAELDVLAQRKLKIAAIVVSESERGTVELEDTVASIARFSNDVDVIGLPRLPGGITEHPAFAKIAALL